MLEEVVLIQCQKAGSQHHAHEAFAEVKLVPAMVIIHAALRFLGKRFG
jgi:hypothetical protein